MIISLGPVLCERGSGGLFGDRDERASLSPASLAPGGVYLAIYVAVNAGGLLHHRFILTVITNGGLFSVALIPRISPDGR